MLETACTPRLNTHGARNFLGTLVLLLSSCAAWTQPDVKPLSTVRGFVLDAPGKPLPQGTVLLQDKNNSKGGTASADDTGTYIFSDLPADTYTVRAETPSFGEAA